MISYSYPERFKAQAVVSALVSKLTDANQVAQRTGVNLTNDLMSDELKSAKDELDKLDQELTAFKVANQGRLPDQLPVNLSAVNTLDAQFNAINDALNRDAQQKTMTEQALTTYKAQYAQMEAALNVTPQEEAVSKEATAKNQDLADLNREVRTAEMQLAVMQQNLTEKHPDLVDLKAKVSALKARRDQMKKDDDIAAAAFAAAPKPKTAPVKRGITMENQQHLEQIQAAIDNANAQLVAIEMDTNEKHKELEKINQKMAQFEARIEASPINEQRYVSLTRARAVASEHYENLQKKQQLAAQGVEINQRKAGETLDVLDTASLPETPTAPNRWQIVAIGAFAGLVVGIAMAGAKEMKDTSLKNLKDVRAYTNLPVLSSIPLLENALLVRRKRRLAYVAWAVAIIVGLCGTAVSVYYHYQISMK